MVVRKNNNFDKQLISVSDSCANISGKFRVFSEQKYTPIEGYALLYLKSELHLSWFYFHDMTESQTIILLIMCLQLDFFSFKPFFKPNKIFRIRKIRNIFQVCLAGVKSHFPALKDSSNHRFQHSNNLHNIYFVMGLVHWICINLHPPTSTSNLRPPSPTCIHLYWSAPKPVADADASADERLYLTFRVQQGDAM